MHKKWSTCTWNTTSLSDMEPTAADNKIVYMVTCSVYNLNEMDAVCLRNYFTRLGCAADTKFSPRKCATYNHYCQTGQRGSTQCCKAAACYMSKLWGVLRYYNKNDTKLVPNHCNNINNLDPIENVASMETSPCIIINERSTLIIVFSINLNVMHMS